MQRPLEEPKFHVLVVDDDPFSSLHISRIIQGLGCKVDRASGGHEAVHKLSQGYYDLMILDWVMPDLTGRDTLKRAQSWFFVDPQLITIWKNRCLPVVCYTSQDFSKMDIPTCPHFQFIGHWKKPIGLQRLKDLAQNVLTDLRGK